MVQNVWGAWLRFDIESARAAGAIAPDTPVQWKAIGAGTPRTGTWADAPTGHLLRFMANSRAQEIASIWLRTGRPPAVRAGGVEADAPTAALPQAARRQPAPSSPDDAKVHAALDALRLATDRLAREIGNLSSR